LIFINHRPGQLGNQLWLNAPYIALCLEKDVKFINLYFENNYPLFEDLNRFKNIKFGFFNDTIDIYLRKILLVAIRKVPARLLLHFCIYIDKQNWKDETWPLNILSAKKNIVFVGSYPSFPNNKLLTKHHQAITNIFAPVKSCTQKVNNIFNTLKQNYELIIGIHIRRGDYKEFLGGIYYFDDMVYARYIHQLTAELATQNKKALFFISSNEKINLENFNAYNVFQMEESKSIDDLYALSLCNYILGVPSTFSMWASYYGKVPLRLVKKREEHVVLSQFSTIIAQNLFDNGHIFKHD